MSEPVLRVEKEEGIATLTLNRPEARNALSTELRGALAEALEELSRDPELGVLILTGAGKAFCAGLDLKELSAGGGLAASGDAARRERQLVECLEAFDRPVIGAINGAAITGGFELALACDILIGSPEARFADTHARVGILPGWGLSQKLPRWIGPVRAKLLSFTGNFLGAEEAERFGLLAQVVPASELLPTCHALARDILSCVPDVVRGYKRLIDEGYAMPYGEARRMEARRSMEHAARVGGDAIAGRRSAVQARGRAQTRD